jgi:hypothetical protein
MSPRRYVPSGNLCLAACGRYSMRESRFAGVQDTGRRRAEWSACLGQGLVQTCGWGARCKFVDSTGRPGLR